MTAIHVALSADARYVAHSATSIHSILSHRGEDDVTVHFLHGPPFPARARERLAAMVAEHGGAIRFHEIGDERVRELPLFDRWTASIWYRIFLPELLGDVERVLYVDADTLAVTSLAPLFTLDLAGHHVGAVTNVLEEHRLGHPAELGLPGPSSYFNSGVILMNLELMRRDGTARALHDLARDRHGELLWPDQDVLNVVLSPTRLALHPRWNRMNSFAFPWAGELLGEEALAEARAEPGILHFEGPADNKPWHLLCEREGRERYASHRRHTPWRRYRPTGLTPWNVARRVARDLRGAGRARAA